MLDGRSEWRIMKIKQLVTERNKALFQSIQSEIKIVLKEQAQEGWGALIKKKAGIIYYSKCLYPKEAFVHELLHLKCQLDGFTRPKYALLENTANEKYLNNLLNALDNELQHHKMYRRYVSLGYDLIRFYNDADSKITRKHILNYLDNPDTNYYMILTQLMTLLSAGSELIFPDKKELLDRFKNLRGRQLRIMVGQVYELIDGWKNNDTLNPRPTIKEIISKIPGEMKVYIGYGNIKEFPKDGDFTNFPFLIDLKGDGSYRIK